MKTLRLVLPLIVLFFSTVFCNILGGVVGDPCGDEPPWRYSTCQTEVARNEATNDSIHAVSQTASVLQITYTANAALTASAQTAQAVNTEIAEMQSTNAALYLSATAEALNPADTQAILRSGAYQVDVSTGGIQYHSTWTLEVLNGVVTGNSTWVCCPGDRVDPLSGTIVGEKVNIVRDCTGQGFEGPCSQTYNGRVKGNIISGTITGTGIPASGATWTLFLSP